MEFACEQCGEMVPILKPVCPGCGLKYSIPTEAVRHKKVRTEEGMELTYEDEGFEIVYYKMAITRVLEDNWKEAHEFFLQQVAAPDLIFFYH